MWLSWKNHRITKDIKNQLEWISILHKWCWKSTIKRSGVVFLLFFNPEDSGVFLPYKTFKWHWLNSDAYQSQPRFARHMCCCWLLPGMMMEASRQQESCTPLQAKDPWQVRLHLEFTVKKVWLFIALWWICHVFVLMEIGLLPTILRLCLAVDAQRNDYAPCDLCFLSPWYHKNF